MEIGIMEILLLPLLIWLLPIFLIAKSKRTSSKEKLLWIFGVVCVSWFACILYWMIAPISERPYGNQ